MLVQRSTGRRRGDRIIKAALLLAATALAGCATTTNGPQPPAGPSASAGPAKPATSSSPASPAGAGTAPAPGTVLATWQIPGDHLAEVITDGSGFAIVDENNDAPGQSTITVYNEAGHQLSTITGGFTPQCGAADVLVPGTGQVILAETITQHPAQGIQPATSSLGLTAWNASTGATSWTATLIASTTDSLSCEGVNSLGYANGAPDLADFGVTRNGQWGLYSGGSGAPRIVNLGTGAVRPDPAAAGVLGDYLVDACDSSNEAGSPLINTLADPATGSHHGGFLTYGGNASLCHHSGGTGGLPDLYFYNVNGLEYGPAGLFFTDSDGTSPSNGLASDGNGLLENNSPPGGNTRLRRYALPDMRPVWHKSGSLYMWGDAGGVLVVSPVGYGSNSSLIGLDDKTGGRIWQTPITGGSNGAVCAITASEILYSINGQLAVLSTHTGKQLSYSSNPYGAYQNNCPDILPGGIDVHYTNGSVTITQAMTN